MIVRELLTRLGFSVDQSKLAGYNGAIKNIKDQAQSAQDSVAGIFSAFAAFASLKSIGKTADEMQSLESRIGMLPQTIDGAAKAFDEVAARATAARSSLEAYGSFYVKMQNAGKEYVKTQAEGLQITDTMAKALVVGGATTQERASALLQFGQAIGSGVLQGEELRAMAEAAPQFMDELAIAIGKPRSELKKMGSEGKLTSKMVIEAVLKMSSVFDEKFKNMPMNIGASMTIIGNRWAMFINKLNRDSLAVTKISNFFLKTFDKIEGGLDSMVDFFGGATNTLKFFGIALAAAFAPMVFSGIVGSISLLLSPIGLLVVGIAAIGLALEDVYQYMTGGTSITGELADGIKGLTEKYKVATVLIAAFAGVVATAGAVWAASMVASGAAFVWLMGTATAGIIGFAITWVISFAQMAIATIAAFWPLLALIAGIALVVAAITYLSNHWTEIMDGIKLVASDLWHFVEDGFGDMIKSLKDDWNTFKSFFGMGVSANVSANMTSSSNAANVTPSTAAASASPSFAATNKAPTGMSQNIITINQTLPPGTTQETAAAAKSATSSSAGEAFNAMARKAGQAS